MNTKKKYSIKAVIVKCVLCYSLITVHYSLLSAQNHKIDSLKHVLQTEQEDTNRVLTLNVLGSFFFDISKYDTGLVICNTAKELAEKLGYKSGLAISLNDLGVGNDYLGRYSTALEYEFKALALANEMGDKNKISRSIGDIGEIYGEQENFPKALEYELKAMVIDKEIGDDRHLATNYTNIGIIYNLQGDGMKALDYELKALEIDKKIGNRNGMSSVYGNIATLYSSMQNFPKALEYVKSGLVLAREIGDKYNISTKFGTIGAVLGQLKQYNLAKVYLDSSLAIALSIDEKDIISSAYSLRSNLDSCMGNFKLAVEDYKKYIVYEDSLVNEADTKKTVQAEMNYEFQQKQAAEKAEQDKKDAIAGQDRKKQEIIRNTFIGGFALMIALAFFIFRGYRQKQSANIVITQQKAVVEEKQKEILDSIHYAQRIQKALLASDALLSKHLPQYFVLYKPKDIVSGDFYWATAPPLPKGEISEQAAFNPPLEGREAGRAFYLAVCDSTGHGVPGAFMSLLNISFLNEAITEKNISQPNEVFNHARKRLIENISQEGQQDGMDGVLIKLEGTALSYSAAYNEPVVLRNKELIELSADKMPVGASPKQNESFTANTFNLQKGDTLYLFTDGFADQFGGPKGKKFKYAQLQEKLVAISQQPLAEQKILLEKKFEEWKGSLEQVDDVLIIGIRV